MDAEEALAAVKAKGVETEKGKESWGDLLALCYDEFVEANLAQPTFIMRLPSRGVAAGQEEGRRPAPDRSASSCFVVGQGAVQTRSPS